MLRRMVLAGVVLAGCDSGSGGGDEAVDAARTVDSAAATDAASEGPDAASEGQDAASDAAPIDVDAAPSEPDAAPPPPAPEWGEGCWHPDTVTYVMDCDLVCEKLLDACGDEVADCMQTCLRLSWFLPEASARAVETCLVDELPCGSALPFFECGANVTRDHPELAGEGNAERCAATATWLRENDCRDADGEALADGAELRCQILVPIAVPEVSERQLACTEAGGCAEYAACDETAVCAF